MRRPRTSTCRSTGRTRRTSTATSRTLAANVESKTRCGDLVGVAARAAALGARHAGRLDQVDTYFRVAEGRLKLRELVHVAPDGARTASAELIAYVRPDDGGARVSRYTRTPVDDAAAALAALVAEHGLRGRVRKRRELWLLDATRIHLDDVEGLGAFVELETVAVGDAGASERAEHDRIAAALGLAADAAVAGSYVDLLEASGGAGAA
jgi:adenylate cyclase